MAYFIGVSAILLLFFGVAVEGVQLGANCTVRANCTVTNSDCTGTATKTCRCVAGYVAKSDNATCLVKFNGTCDDTAAKECLPNANCTNTRCMCNMNFQYSVIGMECRSYLQKLDFDGDCSGANSANCKNGSACDAFDKCRIGPTGNCASNQDKCASGATCEANACVCNPELSTANGIINCALKAKKVGGSCTSADGASACDDGNAECGTPKKCSCKSGYTADPATLTCQSGAPQSVTSCLLLLLGALLTSRLF